MVLDDIKSDGKALQRSLTVLAQEVVRAKLKKVAESPGAVASGQNRREGLSASSTWTAIMEQGERLVSVLALPLDQQYEDAEEPECQAPFSGLCISELPATAAELSAC